MTTHLPTGASISRTPTPSNFNQPTHDHTGQLLPGILMLHGGGSNATVFKIQSRRLIWNLSKQFRFVFAQAPIEGSPGFGMIPVFASCAPFHRWVERRFVAGESDVEPTPADQVNQIDDIIRKVMEENGGVASFKGVIGFSQGARLVAGLLLRQKIEERDRLGGSEWKFAFGVMIGGPFPPIGLADHVDPKDYELLRQVPTVHAWGRDDHVNPGCVELRKACESDVCFHMDFEGGHHLPLKDVEAKDLCDLINAAWFAGGGTFGISADESY
jgi:predicted esterase